MAGIWWNLLYVGCAMCLNIILCVCQEKSLCIKRVEWLLFCKARGESFVTFFYIFAFFCLNTSVVFEKSKKEVISWLDYQNLAVGLEDKASWHKYDEIWVILQENMGKRKIGLVPACGPTFLVTSVISKTSIISPLSRCSQSQLLLPLLSFNWNDWKMYLLPSIK